MRLIQQSKRTVDDGKVIMLGPNSNAINEKVPLVPRHLSKGLGSGGGLVLTQCKLTTYSLVLLLVADS